LKKKTKINKDKEDLTIIIKIINVTNLLQSLSLLLFNFVEFFFNFTTRLFYKYFNFFFLLFNFSFDINIYNYILRDNNVFFNN